MFQVSLGRFSDRLTVVEVGQSACNVASVECGGQKFIIELDGTKVRVHVPSIRTLKSFISHWWGSTVSCRSQRPVFIRTDLA